MKKVMNAPLGTALIVPILIAGLAVGGAFGYATFCGLLDAIKEQERLRGIVLK